MTIMAASLFVSTGLPVYNIRELWPSSYALITGHLAHCLGYLLYGFDFHMQSVRITGLLCDALRADSAESL